MPQSVCVCVCVLTGEMYVAHANTHLQEGILSREDFCALWEVVNSVDGFAFYNSGPDSGARYTLSCPIIFTTCLHTHQKPFGAAPGLAPVGYQPTAAPPADHSYGSLEDCGSQAPQEWTPGRWRTCVCASRHALHVVPISPTCRRWYSHKRCQWRRSLPSTRAPMAGRCRLPPPSSWQTLTFNMPLA